MPNFPSNIPTDAVALDERKQFDTWTAAQPPVGQKIAADLFHSWVAQQPPLAVPQPPPTADSGLSEGRSGHDPAFLDWVSKQPPLGTPRDLSQDASPPGIAPGALTMPVGAFTGGQPAPTASPSVNGPSTADSRQPAWLPGPLAAGVMERPEDAMRSVQATVPNVPEAAGMVGQALVNRVNQVGEENAAAFTPTGTETRSNLFGLGQYQAPTYTPEQQQQQIALAGNAVMGVSGGDLPGASEAAAPIAEGIGPKVVPLIHVPGWLNDLLAPVKNAAPDVQNAIADFAGRRGENAVVADTWARRSATAAGSLDKSAIPGSQFERTGQIAANPTPEQQAFAGDLAAHVNFTGDVGRESGYITGDVRTGQPGAPTHYFPHIYQDTLTAAQQQARGKGGLNPSDFYTNGRVFPTLDEAVAAGKKPVGFSDSVRIYTQHVLDSEAKVQLVKDLKNASPAAVMDTPPGTRIPTGWRDGGGIDPRFQGVAFPEPVAKVIDNVLGTSEFGKNQVLSAVQGGLGEAKSTLFSLSFFHPTTLALQALRANPPQMWPKIVGTAVQNLVVPGAYDTMRLAKSDSFREAARDGLTGLTAGVRGPDIEQGIGRFKGAALRAATGGLSLGYGGYENAKAHGADEPTALLQGAEFGVAGAVGGAVVAPRINQALWENLAPTLKVMTYEIAKNSTGDGRAAAAYANRTFGGNNLAMIARAPLVQDLTRLSVLAPDWWEGWARQIGSVAVPGAAGNLSRSYWLRTAATAAVTLEGLNKALSGHFTNENDPEHRFDLEVTGLYDQMGWHRNDPTTGMPIRKYWDILGPIRSMLQATGGVQQAESFATGRLGILPRTAEALISNQDNQGKPIVPPYASDPGRLAAQGGYALRQIAPIGGQQAELTSGAKEPLPVQALATLGLARPVTTSKGSEVQPEVSANLQDALTRGGVSWRPGPVGTTVGKAVPLTRDERTQYQTLANQYRNEQIARVTARPEWSTWTPTVRALAIQNVVSRADTRARTQIEGKIGLTEAKRRVLQQRAAQAAP